MNAEHGEENVQVKAHAYVQGFSQDFSKGGAEIMKAEAMKKKNCL